MAVGNTQILGAVLAYVGPGSGLAISVSLLTIVTVLASLLLGPIIFPLAMLWHAVRRSRIRHRHGFRKAVILGLDGLDPTILRQMMADGKLPNFSALAEKGHFSELKTVAPPLTPAAWSSFMTGCDPSRHGIYDFVTRDPMTYLPRLSSCQTLEPRCKLRIGRLQIPIGHARVRMLRKGTPFWRLLARHGLETTILRVPITFPPEPFAGRLLSGMCIPDLLGTQGTYTCYTTAPPPQKPLGGQCVQLQFKGRTARCHIRGPAHPFRPDQQLLLPLIIQRPPQHDRLILRLGRLRVVLKHQQFSPWIPVSFPSKPIKVRGIVQFYLRRAGDDVQLYMTPVHLDPERPAMSISHPHLFSNYLAKRLNTFGTLGLIEDTSALNDGVLDEDGFLLQAWRTYRERKDMFLQTLQTRADDLLVCVFDTPDRIQHMFWRQHGQRIAADNARHLPHGDAIERMMIEMDQLVGQTLQRLQPGALLLVISDHGFASFRRCVNLNAWLHQCGYLHLLPDAAPGQDWLQGVDWSRTRAYAIGLTGIYINLKGRESAGIVHPGDEYDRLLAELKNSLQHLRDPIPLAGTEKPIRRVIITPEEYAGPYRLDGPDLIIGYEAGYRCSWECARGQVAEPIFSDNLRPWSGDHCIDPELVPGILLANTRFGPMRPAITDIAPTILDLFGIQAPATMQGTSLFQGESIDGVSN